MSLKRLINGFKHSFFASHCRCIICGAEMQEEFKYKICHACSQELRYIDSNHCALCGRQLYGAENYCFSCQNNHRDFDSARSLFIYDGAIVKLILNYKFHNARYLARYLAKSMRDCYSKHNMGCDVVTIVPISAERHGERGYNQSELLGRELTSTHGNIFSGIIPPYIDLPYHPNVVAKVTHNERQTELTRAQRQANVRGAYVVVDKQSIVGKRVLLIDDIMTTGATCSELARVLKQAGALEVHCLLLAIADHRVVLDTICDSNN